MVRLETREELHQYLDGFDRKHSQNLQRTFFLVEHDGVKVPVYFYKCKDGWQEMECIPVRYPYDREQLVGILEAIFVEELQDVMTAFVDSLIRDGHFYQVEVTNHASFLPESFTIIEAMTEPECLDWMLEHGCKIVKHAKR